MNTLKQYQWAIDYTESIGQKDAYIKPVLFTSKSAARKHNLQHMPQGVVRKIIIKVIE